VVPSTEGCLGIAKGPAVEEVDGGYTRSVIIGSLWRQMLRGRSRRLLRRRRSCMLRLNCIMLSFKRFSGESEHDRVGQISGHYKCILVKGS
jgi:hypothetical protein